MSDRLRLSGAAERLGVHPPALRRWADDGRVRFVRVGRERRFDTADLDAFFMSLVTTFAGRMYGTGGRQAKQRLLARTGKGLEP